MNILINKKNTTEKAIQSTHFLAQQLNELKNFFNELNVEITKLELIHNKKIVVTLNNQLELDFEFNYLNPSETFNVIVEEITSLAF